MSNRKQKILMEMKRKHLAALVKVNTSPGPSAASVAVDWILKLQDALRLLDSEGGVAYEHMLTDPDYGLGDKE